MRLFPYFRIPVLAYKTCVMGVIVIALAACDPDGAALYAEYCAGCHGPLEQSSKRNATLGRIKSGMQSADMAYLETELSDTQLEAIVAALFYEEPTGSVVNARSPYLDMAVSVRQTQIDEWIDEHRDNLNSTDRSYTRYVYITDES